MFMPRLVLGNEIHRGVKLTARALLSEYLYDIKLPNCEYRSETPFVLVRPPENRYPVISSCNLNCIRHCVPPDSGGNASIWQVKFPSGSRPSKLERNIKTHCRSLKKAPGQSNVDTERSVGHLPNEQSRIKHYGEEILFLHEKRHYNI
ncbi:unnamed protein product [Nesidiocoris tenuis]|uniref:Uncharacterized protein n=1 Tax=Nesidiocoris tenuis TaxID=355587 RepID=A0A6H5FV23_9HEMI|nr:unnamed protein product [Nesidiocoris tenuis]